MKCSLIYLKLGVFLLLTSACSQKKSLVLETRQLQFSKNCTELRNEYRDTAKLYSDLRSADTEGVMMAGGAPSSGVAMESDSSPKSSADSATQIGNDQTVGVVEADYTALSAKFLYYHNGQNLLVMKRNDRSLLQTFSLNIRRVKLFATNDRLLVIGERWNQFKSQTEVLVQSYQEKERSVGLENETMFRGTLLEARTKNNLMILAVQDLAFSSTLLKNDFKDIPCERTTLPIVNDNNWGVTKLFLLATHEAPKVLDSAGVVGSTSTFYMSDDTVYLAKSGESVCSWTCSMITNGDFLQIYASTFVSGIKVDFENASISLDAMGLVEGWLKDSWALQEIQEAGKKYLAVASTYRQYHCNRVWWSECFDDDLNALHILKVENQKYTIHGAVKNFAPREDIRAVRFIDRMAYVVTFEKTDPLWSINLENLAAPKIEGHLEIPGFSTYLHPAGKTHLLGVGFGAIDEGDFSLAAGLQFSLFNISDPKNPLRDDVHVFGGRGSYSPATADRQAFFYDTMTSVLVVPTVEFQQEAIGQSWVDENLSFSGARVFYSDLENKKLQPVQTLSHADFIPKSCINSLKGKFWTEKARSLDIERTVKIDGTLVTLSPYGVKSWRLSEKGNVDFLSGSSFPQSICIRFDIENGDWVSAPASPIWD